jgi:enoyl-CoA hydratase/carnithine racemase
MSDLIITERKGHVTRLTLNRPASLNALSDAMLAALTSALGGLAGDPATRVIILRGTGNAFCAGHDLKEMQAARQTPDKGAAYFLDLFTRGGAGMQMI